MTNTNTNTNNRTLDLYLMKYEEYYKAIAEGKYELAEAISDHLKTLEKQLRRQRRDLNLGGL